MKNLLTDKARLLALLCVIVLGVIGCETYDADVAYLESLGITNISITDREHENLVAGVVVVGEHNKCKAGQRFWIGSKDGEMLSGCL